MDGLKVLITGASGFLGSHLCDRLLQRGAKVDAVSRSPRESRHPRLRWCECEMATAEQARAVIREVRPDVVYHLGGRVTAAAEIDLVLPTFQSLLASTVNVLTAAQEVGCRRVILTGSLTEPELTRGEAVPSSPYAAAKWASTAYARMFHELYRAPVVVLRPFMAYGPKQHATKLIPHVIQSLLGGIAPKLSSGQWQADWVYVDDVIDGFEIAATRPGIDGCTIDLGTGIMTSTADVVREIVTQIRPSVEPLFGTVPDRPAERRRVADLAFAKEKLGWEPKVSLHRGLAQTIHWHRDQLNTKTGDSL